MSETRCKEAVWVTFTDSDVDFELQCTKDDGHSAFVWSAKHPDGATVPTEHRFVFETQPTDLPEG